MRSVPQAPPPARHSVRQRGIHLLPNLITLGNATCGFLAIAKGIDALALSRQNPDVFFLKMETAAWLIFLAMVFDALDGKLARMVGSAGEVGGQLDSFADFLSFGCAPALLVKVLVEHEGPAVGYSGIPRVHFVCAALFALMALLRLVRFNLENDPDESAHQSFKGLPSPAAAGTLASTILFYLALRRPELDSSDGTPTPFGDALSALREWFPSMSVEIPSWFLPGMVLLLVVLGLLMVSRVPYVHAVSTWARPRRPFAYLVVVVFALFSLLVAPVAFLLVGFYLFVLHGLVRALLARVLPRHGEDAA